MTFPIKRVQQQEKIIDYQYIRTLKNKEVRKNRFKRTLSQRIFRFILICALLGELGYLSYHGFVTFQTSPFFLLSKVEVSGTAHTTPEEIKKIVLAERRNALTLDLTEIKLQLENHPWIQSAIIWRELPNTICVHITERKPVALVLSGILYLVDHDGRIIYPLEKASEYAGLPIVSGISDVSNQHQIRAALEFVKEVSADRTVLAGISEFHYYDSHSTIVYLKGSPFGLLVSKDGILPMIKKFTAYRDFVSRNFTKEKLIDLRYEGQIILKHSYKEQL